MKKRRLLLVAATSAALAIQCSGEILTAKQAQAYRAQGQPVLAQPDGLIICEAEEFQVEKAAGGWRAKNWGENYYAATFANTFLSRKAFLGAPAQCDDSTASIEVRVPAAGRYLVLARYEAAYRFETQFSIRIEQGGKEVFRRLYGARDNIKIWAFGKKLKKEVAWGWGAVENVVWEGHDSYVALAPGIAKISLIAARQKGLAAKRNVDLVMLTTDEAEVRDRIEKEKYLPLDGLLTQAGDVYMDLRNRKDGSAMTLTAGPCREHSPYWIHKRNWKAVEVKAGPGESSGWVDVGGVLDTLNDGQWSLKAVPGVKGKPLHYKVAFGIRTASGKIEQIAKFESRSGTLDLAYHADTRYSRLLRDSDHVLFDLLDYLKRQPKRGKRPERTLIHAYTFSDKKGNTKYNNAIKEIVDMFALATTTTASKWWVGNMEWKGMPRGYVDLRQKSVAQLEEYCKGLGDKAKNIATVSLGDEIGLGRPSGDSNEPFRAWLRELKLKPNDIQPGVGNDWSKISYGPKYNAEYVKASPGLYYWSRRYQHHYGIMSLKKLTDMLLKYLPNARIGANFSPHHGGARHAYLGEVHKWVSLFRKGGMTMPWGEDYVWQLPVGSPQMNFINLDLSRAGIRNKPDAKILYYVMPHWPGNTPRMWRRQFYGDIGHGMKIVNLFEFRPVQAAYTENHVSLPEMYLTVRDAFYEMGLFEDIMQAGVIRTGVAGLWFSETADIWYNNNGSMAAGKRALYTAILHNQIPLDFIVEEDASNKTLRDYRLLYLTDANVSAKASKGIERWVKKGGRLFATAGAGMFDELNRPNQVMRTLLGVEQTTLDAPTGKQIGYIKQDLPFTDSIDVVTMTATGKAMPVIAVKSMIDVKKADVLGTFKDKSPAVVRRRYGKGETIYCAFLPGLSYFKPAIPLKPVDRGSTDDAMAHLMPTGGDQAALALIGSPVDNVDLPVVCSEPLVETRVIDSEHGMLIPLMNWTPDEIKGLTVAVLGKASRKAELASGRELKIDKQDGKVIYTLDLDVADAIILR